MWEISNTDLTMCVRALTRPVVLKQILESAKLPFQKGLGMKRCKL